MSRPIDAIELEASLVRNAAPTLAGIKPASLFTFPGAFLSSDGGGADRREALMGAVDACGRKLRGTGICLKVLVWRSCGALIYAYRPRALSAYLGDSRASRPLKRLGYRVDDLDACLARLSGKLAARGKIAVAAFDRSVPCPCKVGRCCDEFPHELGFFLGYPYADVIGFMEHEGRDFILMGPWKVYEDREGALAAFERIRTCTLRWIERYRRGEGLDELAVAFA